MVSTPLLSTKLLIPPTRPELVLRPRLITQLDQALTNRLTLVSSPAGFGKTTLLSQWTHQRNASVAWYSLETGDNELSRFLRYFIAALHNINDDIGDDTLAMLQPHQLPPIEALITPLINDISGIPDQFIVILDDYHTITHQPIHDLLAYLLDNMPSQLHLLIATRADPPFPMARLRGRGQLNELRQSDLCFTLEEVTAFLKKNAGFDFSVDQITALTTRTEGWIAGLQMASLSLQNYTNQDKITSFIQDFTGSNRYIMDYLIEEVIARQSTRDQEFLLLTCILEQLTGPLCDAVTAGEEGQTTLERLEAANLFIFPMDQKRQWYRYHHLFADLLRKRLEQIQPALIPDLHRRASLWYQNNRFTEQAIEHSLSAGEFDRAASLIEEIAEITLTLSEVETFLRWLDRLPEAVAQSHHSLCLYHALALLMTGKQLETAEARLSILNKEDGETMAKAYALHSMLAAFQGQIGLAKKYSNEALEQLPEDEDFFRDIAAWSLSTTYFLRGDRQTGNQILNEVARRSQQRGNILFTVAILCRQAALESQRGKLHRSKDIYENALIIARGKSGRFLPIAGEAMIGLGRLEREWNDFENAQKHLLKGIELIKGWRELSAIDGYIQLARLRQAQRDSKSANDAIQEARKLAHKSDATEIDDIVVELLQARIWLAQGDIDPLTQWVEKRGLNTEISTLDGNEETLELHLRKYELVVFARFMIAQNRYEEVLSLLDPLFAKMEMLGRIGTMIEIMVLQSLAFQAMGKIDSALSTLEHALILAKPESYVRTFIDEGFPMARLLYIAVERGIIPEYTGMLLAAFKEQEIQAEDQAQKDETAYIEPLSRREKEILSLVAEGLTNQEIAQRLFITTGTVKVHTRNIYGKLGVHRRTQAIAKAKSLGIL